jgi:hypothetical protein
MTYQNMERLTDSFLDFINKVLYGLAVLCSIIPASVRSSPKKRCVTHGFSPRRSTRPTM